MVETVKNHYKGKILVVIFVLLTIWWIFLNVNGLHDQQQNYFFGASYGLIALLGGLWGLTISEKWGGLKSTMGRGILALSLGLLFQEYGQLVFSYYNIFLHVEVPYPSLADIGFFGTIPMYIIGIFYLGRASGIKFSMKNFSSKLQMFIVPLVMLVLSYFLFLREYEFDWTNPLRVFLDFGYPMGQAVYVSIALLVYSLSQKILGGTMRHRIFFIIIAFIVQYLADYNFLYQSSRGTWLNAGYGDYIYLIAYFALALGLLHLETAYSKFGQRQAK